MNVSIHVDPEKLRGAVRRVVDAKIDRIAPRAAQVIAKQCRDRFERNGWPDLAANDDKRVRKWISAAGYQEEGSAYARAKFREAREAREKVRQKVREGKIPQDKIRGKLRKARNVENIARKIAATGNPSYRKGGKPLLDSGALKASINGRVQQGPRRIQIGSPLKHALYHQEGFSTNGPNYIPFTKKATRKPKGMKPDDFDLVPGYDYTMLWGGVDVPARPIFDMRPDDIEEVRKLFREGR